MLHLLVFNLNLWLILDTFQLRSHFRFVCLVRKFFKKRNPTDGHSDHAHSEAKICKALLLLLRAHFAPLADDALALLDDFLDAKLFFSKIFLHLLVIGVTSDTATGKPTWAADPLRFF